MGRTRPPARRFGKFTKVLFEKNGKAPIYLPAHQRPKEMPRPRLLGSFVETYLLEKSRVVHQERGERNYHVFYQLVIGAQRDADLAKELALLDPPAGKDAESQPVGARRLLSFFYTSQADQWEIPGVSDADKFVTFRAALGDLGLSPGEQREMLATLAGILYLGNVSFKTGGDEAKLAGGEAAEALKQAARLFAVDEGQLQARLTSRNIRVQEQVMRKALKPDEAVYNRDAMAKALYNGLFQWVCQRINTVLFPPEVQRDPLWIGILDVFGFECSEWNNSFEQFCINYANERLQAFFNRSVVQSEQDEYLREGLPWTALEVNSNSDTISLIEDKPNGILAVLDSACVLPTGTDETFVTNLFEAQRRHPRLNLARTRVASSMPSSAAQQQAAAKAKGSIKSKQQERFLGFLVEHYAAKVCYNAVGFRDKNTDIINQDTLTLFATARNSVLSNVLPKPEPEDDPKQPARRRRSSTVVFNSVGAVFQRQLAALMEVLEASTAHFVRCLNPNQFKLPNMFDRDYVVPQLSYGGVVEALRILKLGYPSRVPYADILARYGHILPAKPGGGAPSPALQKEFTEAVFLAFGLERDAYQLGLTKVFFRPGKQEWLENVLGQTGDLAPEMVARIRSIMSRRRFHRLRVGLLVATRFQMWVTRRRHFVRVARAAGTVVAITQALQGPLERVRRGRAVVTLQAALRAAAARKRAAAAVKAVGLLQRGCLAARRRRQLESALAERVAARRARAGAAAGEIFRFVRGALVRRGLAQELDRRVAAARARKDQARSEADRQRLEAARQAELEQKRRQLEQEEKERLAAMTAARAQHERERAEAEARRQREEDEARRAAAAAAERKLAEAAKQAEEQRRRAAAESHAEAASLQAAADEKKKKREDMRRKAQAWQKAQELRKAEKEKAKREQKDREEQERRVRQQQEERQREVDALGRIEDRLLEEHEEDERARRAVAAVGAAAGEEKSVLGPASTTAASAADESSEPGAASSAGGSSDPGADGSKRYAIPSHILAQHMAEKKRQAQERAEEHARRMRHVLLTGGKFLKYGNHGSPHIKYICMNVLGNLHWNNTAMDPRKLLPSNTYIKCAARARCVACAVVVSVRRVTHPRVVRAQAKERAARVAGEGDRSVQAPRRQERAGAPVLLDRVDGAHARPASGECEGARPVDQGHRGGRERRARRRHRHDHGRAKAGRQPRCGGRGRCGGDRRRAAQAGAAAHAPARTGQADRAAAGGGRRGHAARRPAHVLQGRRAGDAGLPAARRRVPALREQGQAADRVHRREPRQRAAAVGPAAAPVHIGRTPQGLRLPARAGERARGQGHGHLPVPLHRRAQSARELLLASLPHVDYGPAGGDAGGARQVGVRRQLPRRARQTAVCLRPRGQARGCRARARRAPPRDVDALAVRAPRRGRQDGAGAAAAAVRVDHRPTGGERAR